MFQIVVSISALAVKSIVSPVLFDIRCSICFAQYGQVSFIDSVYHLFDIRTILPTIHPLIYQFTLFHLSE